jgi:hypothetical protein
LAQIAALFDDAAAERRSISMPTQIVMDHTGDTKHKFDGADVAAVAKAKRRFEELTAARFIAAERTGSGQSKIVRKFDAGIEETLFIPKLQGG